MKKLLSVLILVPSLIFGQNLQYEWANRIGGSGNVQVGKAVTVNSAGLIYIVGEFDGTVDLDPSGGGLVEVSENSGSSYDYFVARYDQNGDYDNFNFTFYSMQAVEINGISVDQFGNVYLGGSISGNLFYDASPIAPNGTDGFVSRFNTNGAETWTKLYSSSSENSVTGIALTSDDDLIVCGYFGGSVNFGNNPVSAAGRDGFLLEYDGTNNATLNVEAFLSDGQGSDEQFNELELDQNDNMFLTGVYNSNTDFDFGVTSTSLNVSDGEIFFAKYDSGFDLQWAKNIKLAQDGLEDLFVDPSGNVYLVGEHRDGDDLTPGSGTSGLVGPGAPNPASDDGFFAKYDTNGDYVFGKLIGSNQGERLYKIAISSCGDIWVYGFTAGNEAFLDPNNHSTVTYNGASKFVASYDNGGNYQLHYQIDFSLDNFYVLNDSIYACQGYTGTTSVDFDPSVSVNSLPASSNSNIYYAKYIILPSCPPVSVNEQVSQVRLTLYPNPTNGLFRIETESIKEFRVYNAIGKLVSSVVNPSTKMVDLSYVSSGIYTIQVLSENGWTAQKLIKQ